MPEQTNVTVEPTEREQLHEIPLSRIVVADGFNPRGTVADDAELEALAETMGHVGILTPIRVRPTGTGDYVLVAGERRFRAAIKAALTVIPAVVRPQAPATRPRRST